MDNRAQQAQAQQAQAQQAQQANPPRSSGTGPRPPPVPAYRVPCRYYNTRKGCFKGKDCRFLHADPATAVSASAASPDSPSTPPYSDAATSVSSSASLTNPSSPNDADAASQMCGICYDEKPEQFGLLLECSHVFCFDCIRTWRDRQGKTLDTVIENMHKTCPACRKHSDLVIPSRNFHAHGTPGKEQVKARYLLNLSHKPCKHFFRSPPHRRWCPWGNECRFSHQVNATRYIFSPFELERIRQERERSTIQRDAQTILGNVMMDARFLLDEQEAYVWDLIHGMIDEEDDMRERQPYEDLFGRPLFDFRDALERQLGIFDDDEEEEDDEDEDDDDDDDDDDERDFDSEEDDEDDEDESIPDLVEDVRSDDEAHAYEYASDDGDGLPALVSDSEEMPTLVSDSEEMPALVSDSEDMPALVSDDEDLPELITDPADDPDLNDLPDLIPDAWTREDWGPSHVDNTDTRPQVVINNTNSPTPRLQPSNPRPRSAPRVIPNRTPPSDGLPQSTFADISPRILFPITVSLPTFLPPRPTQRPLFPPTHPQHTLPRTSQPSLRNTFGAPPVQSPRRFSHPQHTPPPGRRRPHPPRSRAPDFRQPQQLASRRARQPPRPPADPLSAWVDDDAGSATTDGETSERERQRTGDDKGINGLRWDSRANDLSFFDS